MRRPGALGSSARGLAGGSVSDRGPLAVVIASSIRIAGGAPLPVLAPTDRPDARPWRAARLEIRRQSAANGPSDALRLRSRTSTRTCSGQNSTASAWRV